MIEIFKHFMHIYFIVYTILLSLEILYALLTHKERNELSFKEKYMKPPRSNQIFWFTLWILSMYY